MTLKSRFKEKRERSPKHRRWISTLPCIVTLLEGATQCAHVSKGRYSMGMKIGDNFCIPLSVNEHRKQHEEGEVKYWNKHGGIERVQYLGNCLYECTGDDTEAWRLIKQWKTQ